MRAGLGIDQLAGNPHPLTSFTNWPFEDITDAKLPSYSLHIDGLALVGEARIASDHEQPSNPAEGGYDVLDHAIGKVFLLGITTHVLKRQDSNRRLVR